MEIFFALLALCAGTSPVTGEITTQRPFKRSFDVFFYLSLNKRLTKHPWGWLFETPSCSLWRHCNEYGRSCDQNDVFVIVCRYMNDSWVVQLIDTEWRIYSSVNSPSLVHHLNPCWILLIGPLKTYFGGILIKIRTFSSKKMHSKMSTGSLPVSASMC